MIIAFPAIDLELGGINPARCAHQWVESPSGDCQSYVLAGYATHICQICLTAGRDTDVDIAQRKAELLAKETH